MRTCKTCFIEKLLCDFHKANNRKDGHQTVCKVCKTEHQRANAVKHNISAKIWRKNNPDKRAATHAKRRAEQLKATPKWLTKEHFLEIEGFYKLAKLMEKQLGGKYDVDHIVPFKGSNVSGLHVPWNLQVLTKKENIKKSNKYMV
jgi:hypothetical protein